MANYSLTINSKFQPFSFERYMQPIMQYAQLYEAQQTALDTLLEKSSEWERLANMSGSKESYNKYKSYSEDLRKAADDLATKGLTPNSRGELTKLRKGYYDNIRPIERAYERWQELEKEQRVFNANNNFNVRYDNDFTNGINLDDLVKNPMMSYTAIKGDDVMTRTSALAKQAMQAIIDSPEISDADKGLLITKMQSGATLEQLNRALQMGLEPGQTGDKAVDALLQVARTVNESYKGNPAYDQDFVWRNISQGLYGGVGTTTYNVMQDPSYSSPLQWAQYDLSRDQFEWQKEKYEEEKNEPVVKVDAKTGRTTVYDPKTGKATVLNSDGSVAIGSDGSGSDYTTNIDHVIEIGVKGKGKDKIIRSAEIDKASEILAGTKTIDYTDLTTEQQEQVDKQIRGDYPDNYTYYVRDASTGFLGLGIVGDRHESVIIVPKKQRRSTGTSGVAYDEDAY